MNKFINKKNNGFTIVETLVAVAILMISVAGPLTIAQKGLMAALYARDQVTASFLAQEKMEEIKNWRDTLVNDPSYGFIGFLGHEIYTSHNDCSKLPVPLTVDTDGRYHGAGDISGLPDSRFARMYCFTQISPDEVKATVKVGWTNGTIDNVVTLENELFNIQK